MQWLYLAKTLGISLQRCKWETSSTEFVLWKVFLERHVNDFHREDYFLAQIAYWLVRVNTKDGKGLPFEKFLVKFEESKAKGKPVLHIKDDEDQEDILPEEIPMLDTEAARERMEISKSVWGAFAAMSAPGIAATAAERIKNAGKT